MFSLKKLVPWRNSNLFLRRVRCPLPARATETDSLNWPQLQFLHCVEQNQLEGGESTFCDGFNLEAIMRKNHPDEWQVGGTQI
jgi:hypothetical protein